MTAAQSPGEIKPSYVIGVNDKRVPAGLENTARIASLIVAFRDAATPRRRDGEAVNPGRDPPRHVPPGRSVGAAEKPRLPHSEIAREDLERLAAEIAG